MQAVGTTATAMPSARGFDTDTKVTALKARTLKHLGYDFCIRYLPWDDTTVHQNDLDHCEATTILREGLALMAVQHVRMPGWAPSAELGARDAHVARVAAFNAGLPAEATIWTDLEGVNSTRPTADIVQHVNAWANGVEAWGYVPGVYVGADCGLTSSQLYHDLTLEHYWASASHVPTPEVRGYCLRQVAADIVVSGLRIDEDVIQRDNLGTLPTWVIA